MNKAFQGFPNDLTTFLKDLSKNNNREWFNDNKNRYRTSVVNPVCDFIEVIAPRLEKISRNFVADSRPHGGSMFRIYRDTRFSKNKRPYKENVGCHFRHAAGKGAHAPCFYVHLSPYEVFAGGGVWNPSNTVLNHIRTAIVEKPAKWEAVIHDRNLKKHFSGLSGDSLKRPPRGFPGDHPLMDDLKRKSFFLVRDIDPELITSPEFIREVEKIFIAASPLLKFTTTAIGLKY